MINRLINAVIEYCSYIYDILFDSYKYFRYSTLMIKHQSIPNISAQIIAHVHTIERSFSLRNTKDNFGKELVNNLIKLIKQTNNDPVFNYENRISMSALKAYYDHHYISNSIKSNLKPIKIFKHNKTSLNSAYLEVVKSRHSIRNFGERKLNNSNVIKAINLTKEITPSVCNRQSSCILLIRNKYIIKKILKLHSGNSGIEGIQNIIIVYSMLTSFFGSKERNQPFIDGGIFLMTLLNSLHFYNVACCTLNWSVNTKQDNELRKYIDIPNSSFIISLIAIGTYNDSEIKIASSYKKPLEQILTITK